MSPRATLLPRAPKSAPPATSGDAERKALEDLRVKGRTTLAHLAPLLEELPDHAARRAQVLMADLRALFGGAS